MRFRKQGSYRLFLVVMASLVAAAPIQAKPKKATTLSDSKKAIQNKEGVSAFEDQIEGKKKDEFGAKLPDGLTKEAILSAVLAPQETQTKISLVAAKEWKRMPDEYLALLCLPDAGSTPEPDTCTNASAIVAVLKWKKGETPALIARTKDPFTPPAVTFPDPELEGIVLRAENDQKDTDFVRWDTAAFKLTPKETAFGLRTARNEGYSGGFAYFESLHLFRIEDKTLEKVFTTPAYKMGNYAGEWNNDGTRQHEIEEIKFLVSVDHEQTGGFFNLSVRQQKGKGTTIWKWSSKSRSYVSAR